MEHNNSYQKDLTFVLNHLEYNTIIPQHLKLWISHKINRKLRKYNHSNTSDDFKSMYVKYYVDGILHILDFDQIVKEGVFHKFHYNLCKSFFLEAYDDNAYLMKIYESKNYNYFKTNEDHSEYYKWLTENFRKSYNKINNIDTKKYENTMNL